MMKGIRYVISMLLCMVVICLLATDAGPKTRFDDTVFEAKDYLVTPLSNPIVYIGEESGEKYVKFEGRMTSNSYWLIKDAVERHDIDEVRMKSEGGLMDSAFLLNRYFRDNKNIRVVINEGESCVSACAYAAIGSHNLKINGIIAFHPPYFVIVDPNHSINDMTGISNFLALRLGDMFYKSGYSISLLMDIYSKSDLNTFVVFNNENDLFSYKSDIFTYRPPKSGYSIMNNSDMIELGY